MSKDAEEILLADNYGELAEFYEQAIETNPEEITNYWYLSLAYLLQEKEEEAQSIWLSVFATLDEEQTAEATEALVSILDQEAHRQTNQNNYSTAWLLRQQLQELAPGEINNLLSLLELELTLGYYQPKNLQEWGVIELIKNAPKGLIDEVKLFNVFSECLNILATEHLELTEAVLNYTTNLDTFIQLIIKSANHYVYEKYTPIDGCFGIFLAQKCLDKQPDNIFLIKALYGYNLIVRNFPEALKLAYQYYDKTETLGDKIIANGQCLYVEIISANWSKVLSEIYPRQKNLLSWLNFDNSKIKNHNFIYFIAVIKDFLYLEDNPQENRPLQNKIAQIFQNYVVQNQPSRTKNSNKLKIGYVANTLRKHSVGWLSRWLFHYHNKDKFTIAIYLVLQKEDEITAEWFKHNADLFYNFGNDTEALIRQIQQDEIDILIDLDSMTCNLTCLVMAAKPAPIQATWLGLDASGLPSIDYFIADPYVLPENAQDYYQEKIWRLPTTYLAVDGFEVAVPTRRREDLDIPLDAVVYLNIQGALKRHPHYLALQMQIITAVDNSFLLIKGYGDQEASKNYYTHIARENGLSPERLRFLPLDETEELHRANLAIADVVLDTYPYNGATTTLEVLWIGIPIVTRVGEQFAARNSYTFMLNAGISEGIAFTDAEYKEWAIKLGKDPLLRQQITTMLKKSRQTSPLWNAKKFTQEMEKAYEQMWEIYQQSL